MIDTSFHEAILFSFFSNYETTIPSNSLQKSTRKEEYEALFLEIFRNLHRVNENTADGFEEDSLTDSEDEDCLKEIQNAKGKRAFQLRDSFLFKEPEPKKAKTKEPEED